jgi:6-phosphogluconolactonase
MTKPSDLRLLVGTYTATSGGHATGICLVEPDADGELASTTVAVMDDPSFLAVTDDRVYAVSETEDGGVHAFRRQGDRLLEHLWDAPSGGDAPCHVRIDPSGALIVTNYVSGTVTAIDLAAAEQHAAEVHASASSHGGETRATVPEGASAVEILPDVEGPVADRQEGPHAHQSTATPEGTVLVSDLGGDALHEFRIVDGPAFEQVAVHHVAPGVGPRHMVWFDGDLIVAGELDGRVHRLRRDDSGSFAQVADAPAFDGPIGETLLSHIEVTDAGLVYVAARGRDTVAVLDAADGGLSFVAEASCGGTWPRHFAIVGDLIVVANQLSDQVSALPIGAGGVPGPAVAQVHVGSPTCIIPL